MTRKRAVVFWWAMFAVGRLCAPVERSQKTVETRARIDICPSYEAVAASTTASRTRGRIRMVPGYVYDVENGVMVRVPAELMAVSAGIVAQE